MNTTTAAEQYEVTADTIRRWCRTGRIDAIKVAGRWVIEPAPLPATQEVAPMPELYTVTSATSRRGVTTWSVRHAATGTSVNLGLDEAEMRAYAAQLNANPPAAAARSAAATTGRRETVTEVMGASFGLRSHATGSTCHYCGLDARTCDCN
jgi:hypothetical protein